MQRYNVRYIFLVAILGIFAGIISWIQLRQPVYKANVDIAGIPLQIGEWQGKEIPIGEETKGILETSAILMRRYTNSEGRKVHLAIVYYNDSRVALHLPESCYSGQGSDIVKRGLEKISSPCVKDFLTNRLILKGNKGNQVILYYFETGGLRTHSYQAMRWNMMLNKLKLKRNSGALVRFSSRIIQNPDETTEILKKFIKEIAPLLPEYLL